MLTSLPCSLPDLETSIPDSDISAAALGYAFPKSSHLLVPWLRMGWGAVSVGWRAMSSLLEWWPQPCAPSFIRAGVSRAPTSRHTCLRMPSAPSVAPLTRLCVFSLVAWWRRSPSRGSPRWILPGEGAAAWGWWMTTSRLRGLGAAGTWARAVLEGVARGGGTNTGVRILTGRLSRR